MRQLKMVTKIREKDVASNENCTLRKTGLKFKNPSFKTLSKKAFWNKQKWLNKDLIIWGRLPM